MGAKSGMNQVRVVKLKTSLKPKSFGWRLPPTFKISKEQSEENKCLSQLPEEVDLLWGDLVRSRSSRSQGNSPTEIDDEAANLATESQVTWPENSPNEEPFLSADPNSGQDTEARIDGTVETFETSALETPSGQTATFEDVELLVIKTSTTKTITISCC